MKTEDIMKLHDLQMDLVKVHIEGEKLKMVMPAVFALVVVLVLLFTILF